MPPCQVSFKNLFSVQRVSCFVLRYVSYYAYQLLVQPWKSPDASTSRRSPAMQKRLSFPVCVPSLSWQTVVFLPRK
jgi:hypothetical protein